MPGMTPGRMLHEGIITKGFLLQSQIHTHFLAHLKTTFLKSVAKLPHFGLYYEEVSKLSNWIPVMRGESDELQECP